MCGCSSEKKEVGYSTVGKMGGMWGDVMEGGGGVFRRVLNSRAVL